MQRLRILVAPALGSRARSCCSRLMPKRQMCSWGGGVASQGKEAGDPGGFWNDKSTWKALLGGAAVGLCMSNSIAAHIGVKQEKRTVASWEELFEAQAKLSDAEPMVMTLEMRVKEPAAAMKAKTVADKKME